MGFSFFAKLSTFVLVVIKIGSHYGRDTEVDFTKKIPFIAKLPIVNIKLLLCVGIANVCKR